jgi:hypothetical protein
MRTLLVVAVAALLVRVGAPAWYGRDAAGWLDDRDGLALALAQEQVNFEARDTDLRRAHTNRFAGEWALVTHQMTALGLAQVVLAHPEQRGALGPTVRMAALRSWLPEMRDFGTRAWHGEDGLAHPESADGHAYLGYPALAVGMARLVDPVGFPPEVAAQHDALMAAFERRLLASPNALIETYPGEAYPTDIASVAAAIAVHARVTGVDHSRVLRHWATQLRRVQVDHASGFVHQRMAVNGAPEDVPRGSGTGLAAWYAGFVD